MWAPGEPLGEPPGPARWDRDRDPDRDRRRVGARLRAALAGLQELRGLRARQEAAVRGALAVHPPPVQPPPAAPRGPRTPERLEAALRERQHRLQCQDLGLKAPVDQLDQRVSQLQLDAHRTPPEGPDSDSRPSSGFYEMSDCGSCSLSASCTSVCSDRLSCSLGALLPRATTARASAGAARPRSADETTVCGAPLPERGLPAPADRAGPSRPRPVSTGDVARVLPAEAGPPAAGGTPISSVLFRCGLDPKYQRNLVSKGGGEVYLYPSPLHAVALQSPLFALPTGTPPRDSPPQPPSQCLPGPPAPYASRMGPAPEPGAARAYIDKLLGRRGPGGPQEAVLVSRDPRPREPRRHVAQGGWPAPPEEPAWEGRLRGGPWVGTASSSGDPVPLGSPPPPRVLPEGGQRPPRSCVRARTIPGSPQLGGAPQAQQAAPTGREGTARLPTRPGRGPQGHPHSVASSAAPTGLRTGQNPGPPTGKALRMGRAASSKVPRPGRQPPPRGALPAPQPPPTWGAGLRRPPQPEEAPGRSCSECSLFSVSVLVPPPAAGRGGPGAPAQAPGPREGAPAAAGRAGRHRQRRWRSSVELSARARLPGAPGGVRDVGSRPQPPGSPGSRPPRSPEPRLCRIKASKALKKKICGFQPTALKVMTLV